MRSLFLCHVRKFRGGWSRDAVKPHKLFRDLVYFQLSILPSLSCNFHPPIPTWKLNFHLLCHITSPHVTSSSHHIIFCHITALGRKKNPRASFLMSLPGRITHFHLPLIGQNPITRPQLFKREAGKCLLTKSMLGSYISEEEKMVIGKQIEVSATTLNIFKIKICS